MTARIRSLVEEAQDRALEVRLSEGLDVKSPVDIFDLCESMKIRVRFVSISMEGMYVASAGAPEILLSALRPLPRRVFTCAHELGHHAFGHGSTVDHVVVQTGQRQLFEPEEFLVNTFAGALLMPTIGLRRAFTVRGLRPGSATPRQIFTIACSFGVGYETLLTHLTFALRMLGRSRFESLLQFGPKDIRAEVLGTTTIGPLIIVDEHWAMPTIDAEVGTLLLLPADTQVEAPQLVNMGEIGGCKLMRSASAGIGRILRPNAEWAAFVRVAPFQFVGLSQYRHFEEDSDD
jgi:Zn-dependent peptidase ImmA (M78 family)